MDAFGAAFVVAISGLLALAIWKTGARVFRWAARQLKAAYLEWFSEAVDEHVEPKFAAIRSEVATQATTTRLRAEAAAEKVRAELVEHRAEVLTALQEHTQEEGEVVRVIVRDEVAPLVAAVATVQSEVQTVHGRTLAMLADAEEGRRIERDVPVADRTDADQRYVAAVEDDDREK